MLDAVVELLDARVLSEPKNIATAYPCHATRPRARTRQARRHGWRVHVDAGRWRSEA